MSDIVEWVLELEVAEGKQGHLLSLMQDMSDTTSATEPGTLTYEWYTDSIVSKCHIIERYTDSDAAMMHLSNFGNTFADRFMAILKPTAITVYGPASVKLQAALASFAPVHYRRLGGFNR